MKVDASPSEEKLPFITHACTSFTGPFFSEVIARLGRGFSKSSGKSFTNSPDDEKVAKAPNLLTMYVSDVS